MTCNKLRTISAIAVLFCVFFFISFLPGCIPKENVKIYFAKYEDNTSYLSPENRLIISDENFYVSILEELIRGPSSEQLYPVIPSDVKVYSVKLENGLAVVDLSKEIITNNTEIPHSSTTEVLAIFSIVNTLTEFDEIAGVRITVEGKKEGNINGAYIEDFWGHIGIYDDFERNEQVLSKSSAE
jgi:spore germination protein GerM